MSEYSVELKGLNKVYSNLLKEDTIALKDINLQIRPGEFISIIGPSGCGKTTILRMIAGFEDATNGVIEVQGERVEEKEAYERDVNTVFQSYALFPHMTVYDNIAYGLTVKKVPKDQIRERVKEMLELVDRKSVV